MKIVWVDRSALARNKTSAELEPVLVIRGDDGKITRAFGLNILGADDSILASLIYDPSDPHKTHAVLTVQTDQRIALHEKVFDKTRGEE